MRRLERYIQTALLHAYLLVNLLLLGLFGFFDLAIELDDVGTGAYTTTDAIVHTLAQLPARLVELTPFTVLLAGVMALGIMASRHELVIMRAAGLSPARIVGMVLKAGIVMLIGVLVLQSLVAPPLQQRAQQLRASAIAGSGVGDDNSFWLRARNAVVHIGALENARVPLDIDIYEYGDEQRLIRYRHAARADIISADRWRLRDVFVKRFGASGYRVGHHDSLDWQPALYPNQIEILERTPDSLSPLALFRYVRYLHARGLDAQQFEVALWGKVALPLTAIAMLLLAMPLSFAHPQGAALGLRFSAAAGLGLLAYALIQAIGNLAILFDLPAPLCMLAPAAVISALAVLWLRKLG